MVDVFRARTRWLVRQLAIQVPPFVISLVAILSFTLQASLPGWLKAGVLSVAIPLQAVLGYFLIQSGWCVWLQHRGRLAEARLQRRLLTSTRSVSVFAMAVLLALITLPTIFMQPAAPRDEVFRRPAPVFSEPQTRRPEPSEVAALTPVPTPREAVPPEPEPLPRKDLFAPKEPVAKTPEPMDASRQAPLASPVAAHDGSPFAMLLDGPSGEEENPFPFAAMFPQDESKPGTGVLPPEFDRLGLPGEDAVGIGPPPEFRIDMLFLTQEDDVAGIGMEAVLDYSLGERGGIRVGYASARIADGELLESAPFLKLRNMEVSYVHRLAGFTRHADLDLSLRAGLAATVFEVDKGGFERVEHVSPLVGADVGIWNSDTCAVIVRAHQTIPVDLGRGSAAVTGVGVIFRADLSESASFHVGLQALYMHLRSDPDEVVFTGNREWDGLLAGPLIGLDLRF